MNLNTELQETDKRTRKLMNMHKAMNVNSDADRLYIPRQEGAEG